jgi:hypothetical protein
LPRGSEGRVMFILSSIAHTISGFFSTILTLANFLILGAVVAFVGWLTSRIFGPSLSGLLGALVLGSGIVFFSVTNHWLTSDRERHLQAELRMKEIKLAEIQATNAQLQKDLSLEAEAVENNADVIMKLRKQIEAMGDKADCGVPKEFTDELKKLR